MKQLDIDEAKTDLAYLVRQANRGEAFIITDAGLPMAQLMPLPKKRGIQFGLMENEIEVAEDFDAPLPQDVINLFENGEQL